MKIVLFQDSQPQSHGTVLTPWVAAHAEKHVIAQGVSPEHAFRQLSRWLAVSLAEDDDRVPSLTACTITGPVDPRDPDQIEDMARADGLPHTRSLVTLDHPDAPTPWDTLVKSLPQTMQDRLVHATPVSVYPASPDHVVDKFHQGRPFTSAEYAIPAGWDVRVYGG